MVAGNASGAAVLAEEEVAGRLSVGFLAPLYSATS